MLNDLILEKAETKPNPSKVELFAREPIGCAIASSQANAITCGG